MTKKLERSASYLELYPLGEGLELVADKAKASTHAPDGRVTPKNQTNPPATNKPGTIFPFIITFLIMFSFWLIFSGKFDLFHRVEMFVDIALAYAMLNFIAVLAASRYFQKRKGLYDESTAHRG